MRLLRLAATRSALLAGIALGCAVPSVDLTQKSCPCAAGWVCTAGRCAPREPLFVQDSGTPQSGADSTVGVPATDAATTTLDAALRDADIIPSDADVTPDAAVVVLDSAVPDAQVLPPSTFCTPHSTTLLCADFEEGSVSPHTASGGRLAVEPSGQGGRAVHAVLTEGGGRVTAGLPLPEVDSGELWLRFSTRVVASTQVSGITLLRLLQDDGDFTAFELVEDQHFLNPIREPIAIGHNTAPRSGNWDCWEVQLNIGSSGNETLYRNGAQLASSNPHNNTTTGYVRLDFGVTFSRTDQSPIDVWYDDILVSRSRIACP